MRIIQHTLIASFFFLSSMVGFMGCGSETTVENKLALVVYTSQTSLDSLQWQSVSLEIDGVGKMPCAPYIPGQGVTLPEIPFGEDFKVIVEMYGTADCQNLVSRGSSIVTNIEEQDAKATMFVLVSSAGAFTAPIVANTLGESFPFVPRIGASSTVLPDGRVVIIGGARLKADVTDGGAASDVRAWLDKSNYEEILDTVEIYDPATGTFELVIDPLKTIVEEGDAQTLFYRRAFHSAVYLESKNQIAVIGGLTQTTYGQPIQASASIELFDVANKKFLANQAVGQMGHARVMPACAALNYGDGVELILVTGGTNDTDDSLQAQKTYEVIAPTPVEHIKDYKELIGPRFGHQVVQVTTSQGIPYIYLIGGEFEKSEAGVVTKDTQSLIDIFDVQAGFIVGPPNGVAGAQAPAGLETSGRVGHSVHFLPATDQLPASIYVIGGYRDTARTEPINRIEVLNADTGAPRTSEAQNFNLAIARGDHASAVLPDGRILVVGGLTKDDAGVDMTLVGNSEIVGPVFPLSGGAPTVQATIVDKAALLNPRFGFNLETLGNDQVLVSGGLRRVGTGVSMIQLVDALDTATKPAELFIHNPTDLCEGQGFCVSVAVDPAAGVAAGADLTGNGGFTQNPRDTGTGAVPGAGAIPGQ